MMKKTLFAWVAAIGLLVLCGTANASWQDDAVEKSWDFDLSGAVKGVAHLTFNRDYTIYGYLVVAGNKPDTGTTVSEGTFFVNGQWDADSKGIVYGNLANAPGSEILIDIMGFTGKVGKKGTKLKMTAQTPFGNIKFSGVPAVKLDSLVGNPFQDTWRLSIRKYPDFNEAKYVQLIAANQPYTRTVDDEIIADVYDNLYYFYGESYLRCIIGYAALSKGNQIAVTIGEWDKEKDDLSCGYEGVSFGDLDVTATVGKLNVRNGRAEMSGMLQSTPVDGQKSPRDKMTLSVGD